MSLIVADNLEKRYGAGEAVVTALADASFTIAGGEFVALMGESGAGKSTLLSIMGAMNEPTAGCYRVDGIDVYQLGSEQRADFRREFLGFIFQSFHLVPYLSVLENVMLPLSVLRIPRSRKLSMAEAALESVGLRNKARRLPNQISGGEKERVAIARAIVNEPPLILADEPTGNLDSETSGEIMDLLTRLNGAGSTIVMVTHSHVCAGYAGRVLRVSDGRLLAESGERRLKGGLIRMAVNN